MCNFKLFESLKVALDVGTGDRVTHNVRVLLQVGDFIMSSPEQMPI